MIEQRTQGRQLLHWLKVTAGREGPGLSLRVQGNYPATLRPVATQLNSLNDQDVASLTSWRNRYVGSFLTEFNATDIQTRRWLTEQVGPDDSRILFMLDDAERKTIGYMGLAFIDWNLGTGEADAVVRGSDAPRGLMSQALRTLIGWAQSQLAISRIGVRVRSDNSALAFYQKLGFKETHRIPLRRIVRSGIIIWEEVQNEHSSNPSLVHMSWPDSSQL